MEQKNNYSFWIVFHLCLLINFAITIAVFYFSILQGNKGISLSIFGGASDGFFYWDQAQNVANGLPWVRTSIYPWLIGQVIRITHMNDVFVIRIFNFIGYIMMLTYFTRLIDLMLELNNVYKYNDRVKIMGIIILSLYPSIVLNMQLAIIRDIWIYAFYSSSIFYSVKFFFLPKGKGVNLIYTLINLTILGLFRDYAMLSFVIAFIIFTYYHFFQKSKKLKNVFLFIFIIFILYFVFFMDLTIPVVDMSLRDGLNYRLAEDPANAGGSQMWIYLEPDNLILFVINYLHSFIGNLFGPLPWHIRGASLLFAFLTESIIMMAMLYYIFNKRKYFSESCKFLFLQSMVWNGLISITNDNYGTGTRLRVPSWIFLIVIFLVIYAKNKQEEIKALKGNDGYEDIVY